MPEGIPDHIYAALSDLTLEDDLHVEKLVCALRNPLVEQCIHDFPIITQAFLEMISIPKIDELVTQDFLWQFWSKALVEEQAEAPNVTQIIDLLQVSTPEGRKPWPPLPYNSIEQLSEGVKYNQESD
jgi:hypothetical protein